MTKIQEELKNRKEKLQKLLPDIKINPAILTKDTSDFVKKIDAFIQIFNVIDIDIIDNTLVSGETIGVNEVILLSKEKLEKNNGKLSLHFMTSSVDFSLIRENVNLIDEIIISPKLAINDEDFMDEFSEFVLAYNKSFSLGVYINPDELVDIYEDILSFFDFVMLMSVQPGYQGNKFEEKVLRKIKTIKNYGMNVKLDGGISFETVNNLNIKDLDLIREVNAVSVGKYFSEVVENGKE